MYAKPVRVFNNIVVPRSDRAGVKKSATSGQPAGRATYTVASNLSFGGTGFDGDAAKNPIGVDPRFIDVAAHDFRIQVNSPVIDAGNSSFAVATDIFEVARPRGARVDIGAYERLSITLEPFVNAAREP